MKVYVQHNWTSGLGDFLNGICEYVETCDNLSKIGYKEFHLKIDLSRNVYIHHDQFWTLFNKEQFLKTFDTVEIILEPHTSWVDCKYVYTPCTDRPGTHLWDLFLQNPSDYSWKKCIVAYSYQVPKIQLLDFFNTDLLSEYEEVKGTKELREYNSIYFRSFDQQDNSDTYNDVEKEISKIFEKGIQVYCATNSYKFKNYVKERFPEVVTYDIPGENEMYSKKSTVRVGNHYNYRKTFYEDKELTLLRTKYAIFEMLTLSEGSNVNFFSVWGRQSNFLLLSLLNNQEINSVYFKTKIEE